MKTTSLRSGACAALLAVVAGCQPSPDDISLASKTIPLQISGGSRSVRLVEGDVLVVEATPKDGAETMNLCVDASTTESDVIGLRKVKDKCRIFVLAATAPGTSRVRLHARDEAVDLIVDVTPLR